MSAKPGHYLPASDGAAEADYTLEIDLAGEKQEAIERYSRDGVTYELRYAWPDQPAEDAGVGDAGSQDAGSQDAGEDAGSKDAATD